MVFDWLVGLSDVSGVFNLFRYVTVRSTLAFLTTFLTCLFAIPYFIQKMKEIKIGEPINTDAPDSHVKKKDTPTMGGGVLILSILLSLFLWVDFANPLVLGALGIFLGFGIIGFVDDWIKVKKQNTKGLSRLLRLGLEFLISISILFILIQYGFITSNLHIPFFKNVILDLGVIGYSLFGSLVIVGFANAVNLTDGLDGLASFPIVVCAVTLAILAYLTSHAELASYLGIYFVSDASELVPFSSAIAAAGLGFLWYNAYPAQVFMGDVGSLSLGSFLGTIGVLTKNELIIPILGGIFVAEVLSVVFQVIYFQWTQKRLLSMAPLHHHYELKGMSESKIITRFWIVALLLALVSLLTLKIR